MSEPTNYESARRRYDPNIEVGKRVALAPHLDQWMRGLRFGNVIESLRKADGTTLWLVWLDNTTSVWLSEDDLLGSLH